MTAPRAVSLVPLLRPESHRITLSLEAIPNAPPVTIRWNDSVRARPILAPGWNDIVFDIPADDIVVGMNTLTIDAPPGQVNVGVLYITFPP
jgi:hypothetical protein